jgi:hypothetical protein
MAVTQVLRPLSKLVIAFVTALIVAGILWHGISLRTFPRIWQNMIDRPSGPMWFRCILQPLVAGVTALLDGVKDGRAMRAPLAHAIVRDPEQRIPRLTEAMNATARIVLLGLAVDLVYQGIALDRFYPAEAVIVALLFALIPYVVVRGLVTRMTRMWWRGAPSPRT